jgi:hypothetical protein
MRVFIGVNVPTSILCFEKKSFHAVQIMDISTTWLQRLEK